MVQKTEMVRKKPESDGCVPGGGRGHIAIEVTWSRFNPAGLWIVRQADWWCIPTPM